MSHSVIGLILTLSGAIAALGGLYLFYGVFSYKQLEDDSVKASVPPLEDFAPLKIEARVTKDPTWDVLEEIQFKAEQRENATTKKLLHVDYVALWQGQFIAEPGSRKKVEEYIREKIETSGLEGELLHLSSLSEGRLLRKLAIREITRDEFGPPNIFSSLKSADNDEEIVSLIKENHWRSVRGER